MNICANFVAWTALVGACLVIACLVALIGYEIHRVWLFVRRAYDRRKLEKMIMNLRPMEDMIAEYHR